MLRTGHCSTKGVRTYKRTSEQLLQETSDILNKKKKMESDTPIDHSPKAIAIATTTQDTTTSTSQAVATTSQIPLVSSILTNFGFNITSSSVTFNVNVK